MNGNQNARDMRDIHEIADFGLGPRRRQQVFEAYTPDSWSIVTPEDVEFFTAGKQTRVAVNGEWDFALDSRNSVVGQLALGVDPELLKPQFAGGRYFVVDDQILDYRLASSLKFEHDERALTNLINRVGLTICDRGRIRAQSVTSRFEYSALDSEGGQFNIDQGFRWSPFSLDIQAALSMLRLACYNGLVVDSPVMNHKIPVMNGWEDNLAIANDMIRHSFDHKVGPRMAALVDERISLHDMMGLHDLIDGVIRGKADIVLSHGDLVAITEKMAPFIGDDARGMQKNLLKFVPAPITAFDAMNVATECATHYIEANSSAASKLGAFANNMLFSEARQQNLNTDLDSLVVDAKVFGGVDQAFFGITCH